MSSRLEQVNHQLSRIQALIPSGEDLQDYLRGLLDNHLATISTETPMGIVPIYEQSPMQRFASARTSVELLSQPDKLAESPEGIVDIGTMEWLLRPALPLNAGRIEVVKTGLWENLSSNIVERESQSVCRLDAKIDGYPSTHFGTGFIVGQTDGNWVIMTNAHVVEQALRMGWPTIEGLQFVCDFDRYTTKGDATLYGLSSEYNIHPHYDLALLYLSNEKLGVTSPPILKVSSQAPSPITNYRIGVLGHPAFDSRLDPFPKYFGFGDQFGIKRFSPGFIKMLETKLWRQQQVVAVIHDATTLSGSSGSCILDLSNKQVVGLHFGGWPKPQKNVPIKGLDLTATLFYANGAVPLWSLRDDPFLSDISFA